MTQVDKICFYDESIYGKLYPNNFDRFYMLNGDNKSFGQSGEIEGDFEFVKNVFQFQFKYFEEYVGKLYYKTAKTPFYSIKNTYNEKDNTTNRAFSATFFIKIEETTVGSNIVLIGNNENDTIPNRLFSLTVKTKTADSCDLTVYYKGVELETGIAGMLLNKWYFIGIAIHISDVVHFKNFVSIYHAMMENSVPLLKGKIVEMAYTETNQNKDFIFLNNQTSNCYYKRFTIYNGMFGIYDHGYPYFSRQEDVQVAMDYYKYMYYYLEYTNIKGLYHYIINPSLGEISLSDKNGYFLKAARSAKFSLIYDDYIQEEIINPKNDSIGTLVKEEIINPKNDSIGTLVKLVSPVDHAQDDSEYESNFITGLSKKIVIMYDKYNNPLFDGLIFVHELRSIGDTKIVEFECKDFLYLLSLIKDAEIVKLRHSQHLATAIYEYERLYIQSLNQHAGFAYNDYRNIITHTNTNYEQTSVQYWNNEDIWNHDVQNWVDRPSLPTNGDGFMYTVIKSQQDLGIRIVGNSCVFVAWTYFSYKVEKWEKVHDFWTDTYGYEYVYKYDKIRYEVRWQRFIKGIALKGTEPNDPNCGFIIKDSPQSQYIEADYWFDFRQEVATRQEITGWESLSFPFDNSQTAEYEPEDGNNAYIIEIGELTPTILEWAAILFTGETYFEKFTWRFDATNPVGSKFGELLEFMLYVNNLSIYIYGNVLFLRPRQVEINDNTIIKKIYPNSIIAPTDSRIKLKLLELSTFDKLDTTDVGNPQEYKEMINLYYNKLLEDASYGVECNISKLITNYDLNITDVIHLSDRFYRIDSIDLINSIYKIKAWSVLIEMFINWVYQYGSTNSMPSSVIKDLFYNIKWVGNNASFKCDVRISVQYTNQDDNVIEDRLENIGYYNFKVGEFVPAGKRGKISVSLIGYNKTITSNEFIVIVDAVVFTEPLYGSTHNQGSILPIRWQTYGSVPKVSLYFKKYGNYPEHLIAENIDNIDEYDWLIENSQSYGIQEFLIIIRQAEVDYDTYFNSNVFYVNTTEWVYAVDFRIYYSSYFDIFENSTIYFTWNRYPSTEGVDIILLDENENEIKIIFENVNEGSIFTYSDCSKMWVIDVAAGSYKVKLRLSNNHSMEHIYSETMIIKKANMELLTPGDKDYGEIIDSSLPLNITWLFTDEYNPSDGSSLSLKFFPSQYGIEDGIDKFATSYILNYINHSQRYIIQDIMLQYLHSSSNSLTTTKQSFVFMDFDNIINIIQPFSGQIVNKNSILDVQWETSSSLPISIWIKYGSLYLIRRLTNCNSSDLIEYIYLLNSETSEYSQIIITEQTEVDEFDFSLKIYAMSNLFVIQDSFPFIEVLTPNGTEFIRDRDLFNIYVNTNITGETFDIQLFKNKVFYKQVATDVELEFVNNRFLYEWSVEDVITGSDYSIKIIMNSNPSYFGFSTTFGINADPIFILQPTDGSLVIENVEYEIKWLSYDGIVGPNVDIYLISDSLAYNAPIVLNTPNTGSYLWTASGLTYGYYKIVIHSVSNPFIYSTNGLDFEINVIGYSNISPGNTPGESYNRGLLQNITWDTTLGAPRKVTITLVNGSDREILATNALNSGSFQWLVRPINNMPSVGHKIEIRESGLPEMLALSTNEFEIYNYSSSPYLMLLNPNTIRTWTRGQQYSIVWSYNPTILDDVIIYITYQYEGMGEHPTPPPDYVLSDGFPVDGIFTFTLPNDVPLTNTESNLVARIVIGLKYDENYRSLQYPSYLIINE